MVTLDTLRQQKTEIIRLAEMRGCRDVRVFGSVATGENRPDNRPIGKRYDKYPEVKAALSHPGGCLMGG
jgi:predicted nucleotidyltransferase